MWVPTDIHFFPLKSALRKQSHTKSNLEQLQIAQAQSKQAEIRMAVSALNVKTPNLHSLQSFNRKSFFTTKPTSSSPNSSSSLCSGSSRACFSNAVNAKLSITSNSAIKNRVFDVGVGILAASVLAFSPLDADATRIEYYATVGEPLCELNFVRSGLGYCDVSVGPGPEAPYAELIDVSFRIQSYIGFDSYFDCFMF